MDRYISRNHLFKKVTISNAFAHIHLLLFYHRTMVATHTYSHMQTLPWARCLLVWSNKSMAALINGYGFQMKHCTMLCWDCFYLGASSSPPWPGNHNTACDCITVTTGDADEVSAQRFSSPLYLSAKYALPWLSSRTWRCTELTDTCRAGGGLRGARIHSKLHVLTWWVMLSKWQQS